MSVLAAAALSRNASPIGAYQQQEGQYNNMLTAAMGHRLHILQKLARQQIQKVLGPV